jgi:hypothetical protein
MVEKTTYIPKRDRMIAIRGILLKQVEEDKKNGKNTCELEENIASLNEEIENTLSF